MALFRDEVLNNLHSDSGLDGLVNVNTNLPSRAISVLCLFIIVAVVLFIAFGKYKSKALVTGLISTDKGVLSVSSDQNVVVSKIHISDGAIVEAGELLLTVSSSNGPLGDSVYFKEQKKILTNQISDIVRRKELVKERLENQVEGKLLEQALGMIKLKNLRALLKISEEKLREAKDVDSRFKALLGRNSVSHVEYSIQYRNYLSAQESVENIKYQIAEAPNNLGRTKLQLNELQLEADLDLIGIENERLLVKGRLNEIEKQFTWNIYSPVNGEITNISVNVGQKVTSNTAQLHLLPSGSEVSAELQIPTQSSGFIKKGQKVKLRVDAYPYQKYGHIEGRVISVDKTIEQTHNNSLLQLLDEPYYRVLVGIDILPLSTDEHPIELKAGMELSAFIYLEERPIWSILFSVPEVF